MENGNVVIHFDPMAAAYENAKKVCKEAGYDGNLSLHVLRVLATLDASTKRYDLSIYQVANQEKTGSIESLLDINDVFFGLGLALKVVKVTTANADFNEHPWLSFPDATLFDATNERKSVAKVWGGGKLSYKNGNDTEIRDLPTELLEFAPERVPSGVTVPQQIGGGGMESRGFLPMYPKRVFLGGDSDEFTLTLGEGVITAIAGDTGEQNYAMLEILGFRATNAKQKIAASLGSKGCQF
jgi:hypothetical protein